MAAPLKDNLDRALVTRVAVGITAVWPKFTARRFKSRVLDADYEGRELKARVRHISSCLRDALPADYREAIRILRATSDTVQGWAGMVYPDFVEVYGLDDWETSIPALAHFTPLFSSEFAVRPFILRDSERMLAQMQVWGRDPSYQVRRLASEGCRPRLPWATALGALKKDPRPILPNAPTRGLVLFGFASSTRARVADLTLARKTLRIGGRLEFSFTLRVSRSTKCRLEYAIDYVDAASRVVESQERHDAGHPSPSMT